MKKGVAIIWTVSVILILRGANPLWAEKEDLSGVYACDGIGYDGKAYRGMTVIRQQGEAYVLTWEIGTQTHLGIALREGDLLSSTWTTGETLSGIVVYKIQLDRSLQGRYSDFGGKIGTETLTFLNEELPPAATSQEGKTNL